MAASALQRPRRRGLGEQLAEGQPEDLAQGDYGRQPRVERRARAGLAFFQLLVGVRGDPREVGGALLAQTALLAGPLQTDADVAPVLLPGRSPPLSGHPPIVLGRCWRMVIPVWESVRDPRPLWTTRRPTAAMSVALPSVSADAPRKEQRWRPAPTPLRPDGPLPTLVPQSA